MLAHGHDLLGIACGKQAIWPHHHRRIAKNGLDKLEMHIVYLKPRHDPALLELRARL